MEGVGRYEFRLFDEPAVLFDLGRDDSGSGTVHVASLGPARLPLGLDPTDEGLAKWLSTRALPPNRAYADKLCLQMGIAPGDAARVVEVGRGLSLNDSYWVVPEGFDGAFDDYNLFENDFSALLSFVAYTGRLDAARLGSHGLTPELSTGGTLAKAWRIADSVIPCHMSLAASLASTAEIILWPSSSAANSDMSRRANLASVRAACGAPPDGPGFAPMESLAFSRAASSRPIASSTARCPAAPPPRRYPSMPSRSAQSNICWPASSPKSSAMSPPWRAARGRAGSRGLSLSSYAGCRLRPAAYDSMRGGCPYGPRCPRWPAKYLLPGL